MATNIAVTIAVPQELLTNIKSDKYPPHLMQPFLDSLRKEIIDVIQAIPDKPASPEHEYASATTPSPPQPTEKFEITVRMELTEVEYWVFVVDKQTTVERVKQEVRDNHLDCSVEAIMLSFAGEEMKDELTLGSHGVEPENILCIEFDMDEINVEKFDDDESDGDELR